MFLRRASILSYIVLDRKQAVCHSVLNVLAPYGGVHLEVVWMI